VRLPLYRTCILLGVLGAALTAAAGTAAGDDAGRGTPVLQTGFLNYAGPSCPGAGWTCTTAGNVIQTTVAGGENVFECKGGAGPVDDCTIVQSAEKGLNQARCVEEDSAADQRCHVTQRNRKGQNQATLRQISRQEGGAEATQATSQLSVLAQCNVSGSNTGHIHQNIVQVASDASSRSVDQVQDSGMSYSVTQSGPPAGSPDCPAVDPPAPSAAAECVPTARSKDLVVVLQRVRQVGTAIQSVAGVQRQTSAIEGSIGQCSSQPASWNVSENESQKVRAGSRSVEQTQEGPIRCCDVIALPIEGQATDDDNLCVLKQTASQLALPAPEVATQHETLQAHAVTTGTCGADLTVQRNDDAPVTQHFAGNAQQPLDGELDCAAECPPQLTYIGDIRKRIGRRAVLSARLERNGQLVVGARVVFSIVGGSESCSALTGPDGVATCKVLIGDPVGLYLVQASYSPPELPEPVQTTRTFHVRCSLDTPGCT
jgi:hypothetical protein